MTIRKYTSRSQQTTLTSGITASATSMTVVSATALLGGVTIAAGETFTVVIDPDTALEEIVDVYSVSGNPVSGNTFTIVRGIDGSSGQAHSAGAAVRHMAIGRDYRESNTHQNSNSGVHGVTGSVVGTTDSQTLTNKTISGAANTLSNIPNSATTATNANTANAIVARDASGNFAAGTVTANLTGNVTGAVTGNASTATALQTARNFQITGDIQATAVSFNGTGDVNLISSIASGAIVNADINASAAIDKTKIAGTAITAADTGTVTSTMIANGTIVDADINASAAIAKTKVAGTAITAADTGTVTSTMIADGTIVNDDISNTAGIAYGKLSLGGTITSADLVDGTIVNTDISPTAAIAISKLAVNPLDRANQTGTQLASTISDFNTAVRTNRLDQMAAPTASVSLNSQKITNLATPTNPGDAVSLDYLEGQKGANNGIAPLDGTGKVPVDHLPALAISETFVVNSQSAMLALAAQTGDIAVRTDVNKSFILTATPASTLGNWQELLSPTDSVLSVDGLTGAVSLSGSYINRTTGQLLGNLDANTHKVINLGTPTNNNDAATKVYVDAVAGSATAAAASAAAAAASYDSFDDRYLGAKSTPPTVDNDGNPLIVGAIYWNSVSNAMFAWTGSAWGSISSTADIFRYRYTAAGGETSESGPDDNGVVLSYIPGKEQVYLNGNLLVRSTDYSATNGTSITSLAALATGDILEIITFTAFELTTAISNTVFDAKGDLLVAPSADTVGRLPVGSNGQVLTADSAQTLGVAWTTPAPGYSAPTLGTTTITSGATVTNVNGLTINSTTIPSSVTLVSTDATQTLTNKTLTAPTLTTPLLNNAIVRAPEERWTVSAIAATSTINFDALTQGVLYYTTNASGNWTLNVRGDGSNTLNSILATGDSITISFLAAQGSTAFRHTALTIDGNAQTVAWSGGTAPAAGNASGIDAYSFTIIKTAGTPTYTVLGAGPIRYA